MTRDSSLSALHTLAPESGLAFTKATSLPEVLAATRVEPLVPGDPRHTDLTPGLGSTVLDRFRTMLRRTADGPRGSFARVAFTGHPGCGKTTALYQLERELQDDYISLHVEADRSLLDDYDYTYLFLYVAEAVVDHFETVRRQPLPAHQVAGVVRWFADVTSEVEEVVKKEVVLQAEAGGGTDLAWCGLRAKLFSQLKSILKGDRTARRTIKQQWQRRHQELIRALNALLDEVHRRFEEYGDSRRLLLVADNLEKLSPGAWDPFFFDSADQLNAPRLDIIYTVPVAVSLSPRNIQQVFPVALAMPTVRLVTIGGVRVESGIQVLMDVLEHRMQVATIFEERGVAEYLCRMSGGSVRDLLMLVQGAVSHVPADVKQIGPPHASGAVRELRLHFERLLSMQPGAYPFLARLHSTRRPWFAGTGAAVTADDAELFRALLANGLILEYNGGESWYDVHPVVREIRFFKEALLDVARTATPPGRS